DRAEQKRAVTRALEAGVMYFDTAPSYGEGRSEENLGRVLGELGAWPDVIVGTKVRIQPADLADPIAAIQRSCEASLRRLGRASIDLLQLHNPIAPRDAGGDPGIGSSRGLPVDVVGGLIAEGMEALVSRGWVRHVGITGLGDTR